MAELANYKTKEVVLCTYNNLCIPLLGVCRLRITHKEKKPCRFFVVPGGEPALLDTVRTVCDADTMKTYVRSNYILQIEPFVIYYKRLIESYNSTAHNILKNKIDLILLQVLRKQKHTNITTLVSSSIG